MFSLKLKLKHVKEIISNKLKVNRTMVVSDIVNNDMHSLDRRVTVNQFTISVKFDIS